MRQATEEILPRARQKEIQIEICGDIEGKANFDQKWTQEALYNILDNAVKYSPKGSRIEVEGISYEMYFCIAVKDQGSESGKRSGHRFSAAFTGQTWCSRKRASGSDCIWPGKSFSARVAISK